MIWLIILGAFLVLYLMLVGSGSKAKTEVQPRSAPAGEPRPAATNRRSVTTAGSPSRPALPRAIAASFDVAPATTPLSPSQLTGELSADDVWRPFGTETSVHGLQLAGGMLYVGSGLPAVSGYQVEPALVDPALPVDQRHPDIEGRGLAYWPSYSEIPPESRAAYLGWLVAGRCDPAAPIGYVFLYFYGLERRLLADAQRSDTAKQEVSGLVEEVKRLLKIYGHNSSFRSYATALLGVARLLASSDRLYNDPPPRERLGYDLPLELRVAIAQLAVDGKPIPAEWAFAWFINHPDARLRTPAHRCEAEFETLFHRRFRDRFPEGMPLKPNKRRLVLEYHPASASFGGYHRIEGRDLPDVRALSRPVRIFQEIADDCMNALDAYSRYLGRNPGGIGSIEAFGLLPAELAHHATDGDVGKLREWAEQSLGSGTAAVISGQELLAQWSHARPDKLSKRETIALAHVLGRLDLGIEPDVRFGGPPVKASGHCVLFRLAGETLDAPSHTYLSGTVLMHLAAIVAAADGNISVEEERHLEAHLEQAMHMSDGESTRLRAHLQWLLAEQPGMAGLKKRIAEVPTAGRARIAEFAVTVAGADGRIDPDEIKVLRKIYSTLELDPEDVYRDIHALAGKPPAVEPVTVRLGTPSHAGYAIPSRSQSDVTATAAEVGFELDMSIVSARLRDTAEVESLLSGIFAEEEQAPPEVEAASHSTGQADTVAGLDLPHTSLLRALQGTSQLERQRLEALAEANGLLPDGAIEVLNETAFETCDGPLLEGDDPIEIDTDVLAEMLA